MKYYVIGCGGIGCRLVPELARMLDSDDDIDESLVLMDGDKVEKKNLDRQFFPAKSIGVFKVEALWSERCVDATAIDVELIPEYLGKDPDFCFERSSWVFACVDNHVARALILKMCDESNSKAIITGNAYTDAEAYFYHPGFIDNEHRDPRLYYPELLTDLTGDPLTPPCTGEVADSTPQLGLANLSAATYALRLLWAWREVAPQLLEPEVQAKLPIRIHSTATRVTVTQLGE